MVLSATCPDLSASRSDHARGQVSRVRECSLSTVHETWRRMRGAVSGLSASTLGAGSERRTCYKYMCGL